MNIPPRSDVPAKATHTLTTSKLTGESPFPWRIRFNNAGKLEYNFSRFPKKEYLTPSALGTEIGFWGGWVGATKPNQPRTSLTINQEPLIDGSPFEERLSFW